MRFNQWVTNWGFRRVPWCERSGLHESSSATADSPLPRSSTSSSAPYIYGHIRQCQQMSLSFQLTLLPSSLSKQSSNNIQINFCSISNCSRRETQSYISIHCTAVSKVTSLKTPLLFLHTTFSQPITFPQYSHFFQDCCTITTLLLLLHHYRAHTQLLGNNTESFDQ